MDCAAGSRRGWNRAHADRVGDAILSARAILSWEQSLCADGNFPRLRASLLRRPSFGKTRLEIGTRFLGRGYRNGRRRGTLGFLLSLVSGFRISACGVAELYVSRGYRPAGDRFRERETCGSEHRHRSGRLRVSCDLDRVVPYDTKSLRGTCGLFRVRTAALSGPTSPATRMQDPDAGVGSSLSRAGAGVGFDADFQLAGSFIRNLAAGVLCRSVGRSFGSRDRHSVINLDRLVAYVCRNWRMDFPNPDRAHRVAHFSVPSWRFRHFLYGRGGLGVPPTAR